MAAEPQGSKDATPPTCAHNRSFLDALPFGDRADFEDAARGFIGTLPKVEFRNAEGRVIFSLEDYAFLAHEQAPDTVNPSLWRQARLNMNNGLFQVTDRIYQVRGFDISNMTIIEGSRGIIVIDPLVSTEIARAGIELYFQHRGRKPVTAVIYSHSHVDHFGGVRGVIDEADVKAGNVVIIAPDKFMEEVTKENVLAGTPMIRRAMFQFGGLLPKGPRGAGRCRPRQGHLARHRHADPADADHQAADRGAHHRRRRDDLPAHARHRGAGRDAHVLSGPARAQPGRERHPQPAQHLSDPRRAGARCQRLGQVPQRGARPLRDQSRRGVRPASLAGVGQRAPARLPRQAARHLQVPARPDAAAHEPRPQGGARSPSGWRCPRAWRKSGTCAATTAPSATTPRPSTSAISAGTTPTRPTSIRFRPWSAQRRPSPTWAARPRPLRGRARTSPRANTAGWRTP